MSLRNLKIILQNSILVSKNKPLKFKNQIKKLERLPRIFKKKDSAPIKEVENLMINKEKEILLNETSTFPKIKITLLIDDFRIETQALIDPTIYSNFIHEEIIPINLLQKTNLASTSSQDPIYKLTKILIYNNNICLKTSFILVKNLNQPVTLENSFLDLLGSFYTDQNRIKTKLLGQNLEFNFDGPHSKTSIIRYN